MNPMVNRFGSAAPRDSAAQKGARRRADRVAARGGGLASRM